MPQLKNIFDLLKTTKENILSAFKVWRKEFSWPNRNQWKQFFKVLTKTEKYYLLACLAVLGISLIVILRHIYLLNTELKPTNGGEYTEACIGSPRYLNPILSSSNDVDRDIASIIYSSLFRHDENGQIAPELVEKFVISSDRKTYDLELKKDIKWHDGKNLTADDVIYTTSVIQNPDYRSPLKSSLQGVEVSKTSDQAIRFVLSSPYDPFLDNLTFGILPKHIWENIPPASFALSENNLKPIGSGPYQFEGTEKDNTGTIKSLELIAFNDYFQKRSFIDTLTFLFYKDSDAAISAFNSGTADGLNFLSATDAQKLSRLTNLNKFNLPRYFAIFFNQNENKALSDKNVRQALSLATNKKPIIEKIANNEANFANSPLPDFVFNKEVTERIDKYSATFDIKQAQNILNASGWTISQSTTTPGLRVKSIENQIIPIEITILTVNWPELVEVANIIKEQWESLNIKINLDIRSVADIQERIKARQYQAILFGQVLGSNPDPFSFWHSSQTKDPGLNLALYSNKEVDRLLENIRKESNLDIKVQEYNQFQKLITQDVPAVFLYSPLYIFPTDQKIKGINLNNAHLPQDRFGKISKWYIKTKRAWK